MVGNNIKLPTSVAPTAMLSQFYCVHGVCAVCVRVYAIHALCVCRDYVTACVHCIFGCLVVVVMYKYTIKCEIKMR